MSVLDRDKSGWLWLTRAHDHVWRDRRVPLAHRIEVCKFLHEMALREMDEIEKRIDEQFGVQYER